MAVARYFDKERYDGSSPWVALADIDDAEWDALPKHVQRSIDTLPYFRKSNPSPTPRKAAPDKDPPPEKET